MGCRPAVRRGDPVDSSPAGAGHTGCCPLVRSAARTSRSGKRWWVVASMVGSAADPAASIAQVVRAAGVGRVTLYGHFATRADLIDAVFDRTIAQAEAALEALDLTGDPAQALVRLVDSFWRMVDRFRSLLL